MENMKRDILMVQCTPEKSRWVAAAPGMGLGVTLIVRSCCEYWGEGGVTVASSVVCFRGLLCACVLSCLVGTIICRAQCGLEAESLCIGTILSLPV